MKKSKKHRYSLKFWHGFYKVILYEKSKFVIINVDNIIIKVIAIFAVDIDGSR